MVTRVKICGITRRQDAELAIELGAHAVGFVMEPTSKRYLKVLPKWLEELPVYVTRVAVFGKAPTLFPNHIFDAIQGRGIVPMVRGEVRRGIESIPCGGELTPERALELAQHADAIHLDACVEGEYGGTGVKADWGLAAEIVAASPKPVILAGGLTPENVAGAIQRVKPYAVDVSSGVESEPGIKDPSKLTQFFTAINSLRADMSRSDDKISSEGCEPWN